jgi:hypothetical protein
LILAGTPITFTASVVIAGQSFPDPHLATSIGAHV